jgi:hypothetical protein
MNMGSAAQLTLKWRIALAASGLYASIRDGEQLHSAQQRICREINVWWVV